MFLSLYRDNYLPRQGGYVFTCFCLFVCYQDYAKTTQPIFRATEEGLELGLVGLGLRLTFHVTLRRTVLRLDDGLMLRNTGSVIKWE